MYLPDDIISKVMIYNESKEAKMLKNIGKTLIIA